MEMMIIIIIVAVVIGITTILLAVSNKQDNNNQKQIEYSNDILLELSIKQELGNRYEIIPCIIKIYRNKNIELIMENNIIGTYLLDDEKYNNLVTNIDLDKINKMVIKSNYGIKKGFEYFIILFDKDNYTINRIGGYEPTNIDFNNYKNMILSCLPSGFLGEKRNYYIEKLKGNK